ncbi:MAG: CRTAC1 family protein [Bacteroidetes bacterium]|nr:CRTAC1 family protein [Bacteroidota bacterium]
MHRFLTALIVLVSAAAGYSQTFVNKAQEFGINVFATGVQGSGCSAFDWNEDGYDDITVLAIDSLPMFFQNNQGESFTRVYFEGIDLQDTIMMVTWVDIDNDSDKDLAFNIYEGGPRLYRNNGDFVFEDVTAQSGIIQSEDHWGYGLNWGDFDLDGDLDLYVANYNWDTAPAGTDMLYKNNGDFTFSMVNLSAGIANEHAPTFQGVWLDYDFDLDPDLIIANDREAFTNLVYRNNGNGQFTNFTNQTNFTYFICSMCATVGDYDNDGRYDIYFTNTPFTGNRLFRFSELNYFQEVSGELGVRLFQYSWGSTWLDYDNDGWQDLYVGTELYDILETNIGENYLLRNTQNGFEWQFDAGFGDYLGTTNSLARADFNNDGAPDLLTHSQAPLGTGVWINNEHSNNYLRIMPKGVISNRDGVGVRMELYTPSGNQYRYTLCGEQYISQNTQWQHFGLGSETEIDSLILKWPSGHIDVYFDVDINESIVLQEGSSLTNEIAVLTGSLSFCPGSQVLLDGGEWESYLWSTGDTTRTIWVNSSDTVSLVVFDGTFSIEAEPVIVQVFEHVAEDIISINPGCAGDANGYIEIIPFAALSNVQVDWSQGSTGLSINNLAQGNYIATISAEAGSICYDTLEVTLTDPPVFSVDSISFEYFNGTGSCVETWTATPHVSGGSPPYSFIWSVTEISGGPTILEGNGNSLACIPADRPMSVTCIAADAGTCMEEFESTSNSAVGVEDLADFEISVFPQPASDIFYVSGIKEHYKIEIYNLLGQQVNFTTTYKPGNQQMRIKLIENSEDALILVCSSDDFIYRRMLQITGK